MANPQLTLSNAYPGATAGKAVLDQSTGDYWIYDGTKWINYGPVLGATVDIANQLQIWNEVVISQGVIKTGIDAESIPYGFGPFYTNFSLTNKIGVTVLQGGTVFPYASVITITSSAPARPLSSAISCNAFGLITILKNLPSVTAQNTKIIPVSVLSINLGIYTPIANKASKTVNANLSSIAVKAYSPVIDGVNDSSFQYTILQVQSKGAAGTKAPMGRWFPDTSARRNTSRCIEISPVYNKGGSDYYKQLPSYVNTFKGITYSSARAKYGSSSMLFASKGSWLQIGYDTSLAFGTGIFCMEAWVYFTDLSTEGFLFSILKINSTAAYLYTGTEIDPIIFIFLHNGAIQTGVWQHIALTRDSSQNCKLFVNGVQVGATQNVTNNIPIPVYTIGAKYYLPDIIDPQFNLVSALFQFTEFVNLSVVFTESSGNAIRCISNGSHVSLSTNVTKFALYSMYFDGISGIAPEFSNSNDPGVLDLRTTDFTMEAWIYPTAWDTSSFSANEVCIASKYSSGGNKSWAFCIAPTYIAWRGFDNQNTFFIPYDFTLDTWYHVAAQSSRTQNNEAIYLYVNGVLIGSQAIPVDNYYGNLYLGYLAQNNLFLFKGYMSSFRLTKRLVWGLGVSSFALPTAMFGTATGVNAPMSCDLRAFLQEARVYKGIAKYTANFTPPASSFAGYYVQPPNDETLNSNIPDSSVQLLIPGYGQTGSTTIKDFSNNNYALTASPSYIDDPTYDPYYSNVTYLFQPEGPENSITFTEKKFGYTIATPSYTISNKARNYHTATSLKYSEYSATFDLGNPGAMLDLGNRTGLDIGQNDTATFEFWVRPKSTTSGDTPLITYQNWTGAPTYTRYIGYSITVTTYVILTCSDWPSDPINGRDIYSNDTNKVQFDQWNHVAVVQQAGIGISIYINGNYAGGVAGRYFSNTGFFTATNSSVTVGNYYNFSTSQPSTSSFRGLISEFRITKGIARYTGSSYDVPKAKFPSRGGTPPSILYGDAKTSLAVDPFNNLSRVIDISNGATVNIATNSNLVLGKSPFCIEYWLYLYDNPTGAARQVTGFHVLDGPNDTSPRLLIDWDDAVNNTYSAKFGKVRADRFHLGKAFATSGNPITVGTWNHVAYTRDSLGEARLFINGVLQETPQFLADFDANYRWPSLAFGIANNGYQNFTSAINTINSRISYNYGLGRTMNGYVCDIRVTKGYSRYLQDFSVPTTRISKYVDTSKRVIMYPGAKKTIIANAPLIFGSRPYVYAITEAASSTGILSLAWPSGLQVGDIALLHIVSAGAIAPVLAAPAGFTGIDSSTATYNSLFSGISGYGSLQSGNSPRIYAFKQKLATTSPTALSLDYSSTLVRGRFITGKTTAGAQVNLKDTDGNTFTGSTGGCGVGPWIEKNVLVDSLNTTYVTAAYNTSGNYEIVFANSGSCSSLSGATWGIASTQAVTITVKIVRTAWDGTAASPSLRSGGNASTLQLTAVGSVAIGGATTTQSAITGTVWTTGSTANVTTNTYTIAANSAVSSAMISGQLPKLVFAYVGGGGGTTARSGVGIVDVQMSWGGGAKVNGHLAIIRGASSLDYDTGAFRVMTGSTFVDSSYPSHIWADRMQACSKATTTASTAMQIVKPYALTRESLIFSIVASQFGGGFTTFGSPSSSNMLGLTKSSTIANTVTVNSDAPSSCIVYGHTSSIGSPTSTGVNTTGTVEYINISQTASAQSISISYIFDNSEKINTVAYYLAEIEARNLMPKYSAIYDALGDLVFHMYTYRWLKVGLLAGFDDISKCHAINIFNYNGSRDADSTVDLRRLVTTYSFNNTANADAKARICNFKTTPVPGVNAGQLISGGYSDYSPVYGLKGNPLNKTYITASFLDDWDGIFTTQGTSTRDYTGGTNKNTKLEGYGFGDTIMGTNDLRYFNRTIRATDTSRPAWFAVRRANDNYIIGSSDMCAGNVFIRQYGYYKGFLNTIGTRYNMQYGNFGFNPIEVSNYKAIGTYRNWIQNNINCGPLIASHTLEFRGGIKVYPGLSEGYEVSGAGSPEGYSLCSMAESTNVFENVSTHVLARGDDPFYPNHSSYRVAALYYQMRAWTGTTTLYTYQQSQLPYGTGPASGVHEFLIKVAKAYGYPPDWTDVDVTAGTVNVGIGVFIEMPGVTNISVTPFAPTIFIRVPGLVPAVNIAVVANSVGTITGVWPVVPFAFEQMVLPDTWAND